MGTNIDQLQIEIETKSEGAERRVNKLTSALERLDKVSKNSGLDKTVKRLEKIASLKFSNLNSLNKVKNSTASMKTVKARVKNVTPAISSTPAEIKPNVDSGGISDTVDKIKTATSAIKNIPKKVDIPVKAPGVESTNSKLSLARKVLSGVKSTASTVGTKIVSLGKRFKTFGTTALACCKKSLKGLTQLLKIVVIYGGAFRAYMLFTQGVSEGLQNIAKYSDETATSMNKLSTMSLYLKNSIGAAVYPVIVQITPALEAMANAIIKALNAFNQFVAAWGGSTTFIKAKSYLKEYGETATETANKIKKSFAGMDEITVIGNNDSSGSGSSTPDYSQMFETVPVSSNTTAVVDNIKQNLDQVKIILGGAALAVGALLTFSGANIPLGLGLMVVGAVAMASGISENWDATGATLEDKFSNIMYIISGAMLVLGAILTFASSITRPLGIALLAGGALTLATAVTENWEGLPENIKNTITIIGIAVGAAMLVLGTVLAFSGASIPLGIGLMVAGASLLTTAATLGWDTLPDKVKNTLTIIGLAVSAAFLVLGVCLAFTGFAIPLGIALLAIGAAGLVATAKIGWNALPDKVKNTLSIILAAISVALIVIGVVLCFMGVGLPIGIALIALGAVGFVTAVAVNWDWVKEKINTVIASILAIISAAGLVLGILLCLTGAGIPLGIALIMASIKGVQKASDMDDNPVTKFVKKMVNGIIDIFESGINYIVTMLNNLSFDVPDWVPGIGGSTFGFNIKPVKIPRLKDGGFPDGEDGLFFANHNELVGKFSNGKTAVANNDQIVEGIRSGVYDANQEQNNLLREQNKLLRQLLNKESGAEVNISTITKAQNRMNQRHGKTIVPVGT